MYEMARQRQETLFSVHFHRIAHKERFRRNDPLTCQDVVGGLQTTNNSDRGYWGLHPAYSAWRVWKEFRCDSLSTYTLFSLYPHCLGDTPQHPLCLAGHLQNSQLLSQTQIPQFVDHLHFKLTTLIHCYL